MTPVRRVLSPSLNPAGFMAAAGAIYAAVVMIWNATHHHGVIQAPVIVAALAAAWGLYTRFKVTPVKDPRDGNGNPLHGPAAGGADKPASPSNVTLKPPAGSL